MKRASKKLHIPGKVLAPAVSLAALLCIGGGLLGLWRFTGYAPLLLMALIALMPGVLTGMLALPFGRERAVPPAPEGAKKHTRLLHFIKKLLVTAGNFWTRRRTVIVAVAVGAVLVLGNWYFWKPPAVPAGKLGAIMPVALGVLFVVCIVFEKWCSHAMTTEDAFLKALLQNVRSALAMVRLCMILGVVTLAVKLLGFYDLTPVLKILLTILFVYETAMLAFALAIRLIRQELATVPAFPMSVKDMGTDGLLTYLEQNTGITMRSLWSMKLMKTLVPGMLMFIILLVWVLSGLVQIEPNQQGALYRVGKLQTKILEPGIHLTLPWPFDQVEIYDTKSVREIAIGYTNCGEADNLWTESHQEEYRLLLGGGNEMISINLRIEYRIDDLYSYLSGSAAPESLLQAAAYEIVTARTIGTDLDTLLAADRVAFSQSFQEELTERVGVYDTGLTVVDVVLESIHPPVEVAAVYQETVSAGLRAERLVLDAQSAANVEIIAAQNQALTTVSVAKTAYYQAVAAANAAVAEFMASVEADASYHTAYRHYKIMQATILRYTSGTWIIVGNGVDAANLYIGNYEVENTEEDFYVEEEGGEYDDSGNYSE